MNYALRLNGAKSARLMLGTGANRTLDRDREGLLAVSCTVFLLCCMPSFFTSEGEAGTHLLAWVSLPVSATHFSPRARDRDTWIGEAGRREKSCSQLVICTNFYACFLTFGFSARCFACASLTI